jgi:hypothetical protein
MLMELGYRPARRDSLSARRKSLIRRVTNRRPEKAARLFIAGNAPLKGSVSARSASGHLPE